MQTNPGTIKGEIDFFTQCYEKDYQLVLNKNRLISLNKKVKKQFNIIINLSRNYQEIKKICENLKQSNIISDFFCVNEKLEQILNYFNVEKCHFKNERNFNICLYGMAALFFCKSEYLCFFTGDSMPIDISNFVQDSIKHDEKNSSLFTYMLSWTQRSELLLQESCFEDSNFYYNCNPVRFSDQNFLINAKKLNNYKNIFQDFTESGFPDIDAFESRFNKFMLKNDILRCVYKHGTYIHENFF